jgi:hypothetical protein
MKPSRTLLFTFLICSAAVIGSAQTPRYGRVISQAANLRELPSPTSNSTQEVSEETLVKVLDEKLPWYVVRVGNRVGWMHGDTLEFIGVQGTNSSQPTEQSTAPLYTPPSTPTTPSTPSNRSSSNSEHRGYIRGSRGGCYYISGSGRKVYVDRSMCN